MGSQNTIKAAGRYPLKPNTLIGGMSSVYTSALVLKTIDLIFLNIRFIKAYRVVGTNVGVTITSDYDLWSRHPWNEVTMTYWIDIDGYCKDIQHGCFYLCTSLQRVWLPEATRIYGPSGYYAFQSCDLQGKMDFPSVDNTGNAVFNFNPDITCLYYPVLTQFLLQNIDRDSHRNLTSLERLYTPIISTYTEWYWRYFMGVASGVKWYVPAAWETSGPGSTREEIVVYMEDTMSMVPVYIQNFTAPSAVSDLDYSSITSSSVDLDFTPPSSTNALDFYEVWIDDGVTEWHPYCRWQEITGSGGTVSGLASGTTYKIKIKAADIYYNLSGFSNEIEITTS